ncbi:MAG: GNAT family N-acetyltransferase [Candidatus Velamenicoccus archaeovorus]
MDVDERIRPADLVAVRELRQRVLRPHQRADELVYPGDDHPDALHAGAFDQGRLVGIATIVPEPPPDVPHDGAWRVRGMATLPEVRGQGFGAALLRACLDHAAERGGSLVWCNARATAVEFYRRFGFQVRGAGFTVPVIGLHFLMWRRLDEGG